MPIFSSEKVDDDDEKSSIVDLLIQFLLNEKQRNQIKPVLDQFFQVDDLSDNSRIKDSLLSRSAEDLRNIFDSCLDRIRAGEDDVEQVRFCKSSFNQIMCFDFSIN